MKFSVYDKKRFQVNLCIFKVTMTSYGFVAYKLTSQIRSNWKQIFAFCILILECTFSWSINKNAPIIIIWKTKDVIKIKNELIKLSFKQDRTKFRWFFFITLWSFSKKCFILCWNFKFTRVPCTFKKWRANTNI